jgi:hypothetical protein
MYTRVTPEADAVPAGRSLPSVSVRAKAVAMSAIEWLRQAAPWRIDAVLATFFVLVGVMTTDQADPLYEPRDAVAIGLILAATVPYYARRRA